jgi:CheY-like chemotaxis protein
MSDSHRKRLLVVDDQAAMGVFIAHVAKGMGFDVENFTDARHFLDALGRGVADVVMIDLAMPGMDGVDVIDKMAEGHSPAAVFVFSGFARKHQETVVQMGLDRGLNMAGCIEKPIRAADLRNLLSPYSPLPGE